MVYNFGNPFAPPAGSFPMPVTPPDSDPDEGELTTVCFSVAWLPFVVGALQQLGLQATWKGDDDAVLLAQSRAQTLIAMFGDTNAGCVNDVCFDDVIYDPDTDTVKQTFDGGESYVDAPYADPRHAETFRFPPVEGDDKACQAAANMTRQISNLIGSVTEVVGVAGAAEGLLAIVMAAAGVAGPFGVVVDLGLGLAFLFFSAGATALSSAFTNDVYDTLTCIFFCHCDPDGRLTAGALEDVSSDIADQIGGLVSVITDGMFLLMGEVGLSNWGAIGDAPADCSGCDTCEWCVTADFNEISGNFEANHLAGSTAPCGFDWGGLRVSGQGWVNAGCVSIAISILLPAGTEITHIGFHGDSLGGTSPAIILNVNSDIQGTNVERYNAVDSGDIDVTLVADTYLALLLQSPSGTTCGEAGHNIDSYTISGRGTKPEILVGDSC